MADKNKYAGVPDERLRSRGGQYFQNLRKAKGLTQAEMARLLGYEYYTFVSQIETGRGRLPDNQIELAARILDVDPKEFARKMMVFYYPSLFAAVFGVPTKDDLSTRPGRRGVPSEEVTT